MSKSILLSILFLFSLSFMKGQDVTKPKEHYRLLNPKGDFSLNYEKALTRASLDSLRFVEKRRQIPIEGTNMVLELFSAKELLEKYQKPILPINIADASKAQKVKLRMNGYGLLDGVLFNK